MKKIPHVPRDQYILSGHGHFHWVNVACPVCGRLPNQVCKLNNGVRTATPHRTRRKYANLVAKQFVSSFIEPPLSPDRQRLWGVMMEQKGCSKSTSYNDAYGQAKAKFLISMRLLDDFVEFCAMARLNRGRHPSEPKEPT